MSYQALLEDTYKELKRKQTSIGYLFPPFRTRVKKVAGNGGVRLQSMTPEVWRFKVASGSKPGKKYDVYVRWRDIDKVIKDKAQDMRLWKTDKSGVDIRKLGSEVLMNTDMELVCTCPADLYWGGQYIRTMRKAKFTDPETRPPKVRNPKEYGAYCKHIDLVMEVLPMYASTMGNYIKRVYKDALAAGEEIARKRSGLVKQAADFLKKKREEEEEEAEVEKAI